MKTIRDTVGDSVYSSVRDSIWSTVEVHVIRIVYDADSGRARSSVMKSVERSVYKIVYRNFLLIEKLMKVNK